MTGDEAPVIIRAEGVQAISTKGDAVGVFTFVRDIADHFPARAPEWIMTAALIWWGVILALPNETFSQSQAWARMARLGTEQHWAAAAIVIGTLRLIALIINGTLWRTWYGQWSPHVRSIGSLLSSAMWAMIAVGLTDAPYITTGLAAYPALALIDLRNASRAKSDAARLDGARDRERCP